MAEPTNMHLPPEWPYPVRISSIDAPDASSVARGTRLLTYSFEHQPRGSPRPELRFGTWDSAIDGSIETWHIRAGDVLSAAKARAQPALTVTEPCKHGVQHGGMCVVCGKDMDMADYMGSQTRASIQMTHSANGPTVSFEEAQRIDRETADYLLSTRRLSLIVDLDQTIVHATVDPTVGEWIAEGKAWETRAADDETECHPNWEALKDVKEFRLGPELAQPIESDGTMYYIKPRPGWEAFLNDMATRYEMHVYTMGTRAYAEKVCAAIDPNGHLFGGRLLSRDESGSLTSKSLKRLFPCDTSMVVIIDDRGDVWEWSPNLIKVLPYDFFVGIGDINSAFLPKLPNTTMPQPLATMPDQRDATLSTTAMITQNSIALEAQVEERPLAKMQEKLEDTEQTGTKAAIPTESATELEPTPPPHHPKKALLKNDDTELERVGRILTDVHRLYFEAYDAAPAGASGVKRRGKKDECDVTTIIPVLKAQVLPNVHIVFSSMFPLDIRPEATDVWKMCESYGAKCHTDLNDQVTHVVAAKQGTDKVNSALRRHSVKVVWAQWLTDSVNAWKHLDESVYLMDPTPTSSRTEVLTHGVVVKDKHHAESMGGELEMGDINWQDINDEVDAAMNESDDEDEPEYQEGAYYEYDDESEAGTPSPKKRSRSTTPKSDSDTASPDTKRRKLEGSSLKEGVTAADLDKDDDDDDEEDDFDDDFLAKELEEEWG